jgi:hypothetical protein
LYIVLVFLLSTLCKLCNYALNGPIFVDIKVGGFLCLLRFPPPIKLYHKMFDMFTSRNVKKIFKYPLSPPTTIIVGLRECWLLNLSDILGGICPIWEYDRWYTWECTVDTWKPSHLRMWESVCQLIMSVVVRSQWP